MTERMKHMDKLFEQTLEDQQIFAGKIIDVHLQKVKLPNGKESYREVVFHPGAVAIIPLTPDGKLIVVRQFRKALNRSIIEIPAGKLEKNEDPHACALRELREETGCTVEQLKKIVSFYTSPGFANEIIHLFLAENCIIGNNQLDEDEFVELVTVTLEEAKQLIAQQQIIDAKTILAVYYWELMLLTDGRLK